MTQGTGPYVGTTYTPDPLEIRESDDASPGAADQARHVAGEAKDQAADVGATAKEAGGHVAGVAQEQAKNVASEAAGQARDIAGQAAAEVQQQAQAQQQRAAAGLHSIGDQLKSMAGNSEQSGVVTDLTHEAADRVHDIAGWLDQRDPGAVLGEVKDFARRRPGTFLLIAAGAGLVAGRLTRGIKAAGGDDASSDPSTGAASPSATAPSPSSTTTYVAPSLPVTPAVPAATVTPATSAGESDPFPVPPTYPSPSESGRDDFFEGGRG